MTSFDRETTERASEAAGPLPASAVDDWRHPLLHSRGGVVSV